MKRTLAAAILCLPLLLGPAGAADDETRRRLAVNRTMLARYEAEYGTLAGLETHPSGSIRKELDGLKIKLDALKEDNRRLSAALTDDEAAAEFLKDVVARTDARPERASRGAKRPTHELHEKGLSLVAERRLGEAAAVYEDILLEDPDDDQACLILGHVRALRGDYAGAEESFKNAVHIDSQNIEEIVPFYENLLVQSADTVNYERLGFAKLMVGDAEGAAGAFGQSLAADPTNAAAAHGLALARGEA